jgi:hypothetical protein
VSDSTHTRTPGSGRLDKNGTRVTRDAPPPSTLKGSHRVLTGAYEHNSPLPSPSPSLLRTYTRPPCVVSAGTLMRRRRLYRRATPRHQVCVLLQHHAPLSRRRPSWPESSRPHAYNAPVLLTCGSQGRQNTQWKAMVLSPHTNTACTTTPSRDVWNKASTWLAHKKRAGHALPARDGPQQTLASR